ncbi:beta-galactosidase [Bacteroidia bacterium]|nr:beta-galactosidase [Bacteroidia bacterium]
MKTNLNVGSLVCCLLFAIPSGLAQGIRFDGDFSPAEGLTIPQEAPYREEICLNGFWDLQIMPVPASWESGTGVAPELPLPLPEKWETTRIKIPSPVNVNNWGSGNNVGEGTDFPYAPSSVYYPSYPKHWDGARMVWLKKQMILPEGWKNKRLLLHFEAVAGECVVLLNGKEVARNFDAHLPFEADITEAIQPDGANEIRVGLRHSRLFDKKHPKYKYFGATYPTGSNTDDLIGIWQDVFLFAVPDIRITNVFIKPWLSQNELEVELQITNQTNKKQKLDLTGSVQEWLNDNEGNPYTIRWHLGEEVLNITLAKPIEVKAGETKTVHITTKVGSALKTWSPDAPNLYTLLLHAKAQKQTCDIKATRFGWRQFTIVGDEFHLNGKKIQCFGDIQHPFSAYICSRRFAYAWYQMIKDFGGNAVRPHAQPWSRVYYDLADEMGLMVLDETALFGSSIRLNLEEDITWERSHEHLKRLILRDRNHPSVVGWSAGNEMFAIALLNKPEKEVSARWDAQLVKLALSVKQFDTTRDFITLDGDRDMDGQLPVWSKHFGHGLNLKDLPENLHKPLIVGESGATYYGRPIQLYPFAGDAAFRSYRGRSEALAVDVYQNAAQMALPYLSYYSPSEVSWFGIEHLNLGYSDYSRLPNLQDGIFAGKPYEEGKPGYQYERIPPYVTTFNPGLDPSLPLYRPLPMFEALQAALRKNAPTSSPWDTYKEHLIPEKPVIPSRYNQAYFVGDKGNELYNKLANIGIDFSEKPTQKVLIVDAENVTAQQCAAIQKPLQTLKKEGGIIWMFLADKPLADVLKTALLPLSLETTNRRATSLDNNPATEWGKYFSLPDLYFAEVKGDRQIIKQGLAGTLVEKGNVVLAASNVDWSLFNEQAENRKCAQVVLYEHLEKPAGAALVTHPWGKATLVFSTLDYRPDAPEYITFWRNLLSVMEIKWSNTKNQSQKDLGKEHNLLLDGPVE